MSMSPPESLTESGSYPYADNTCIFHQDKDVQKIEDVLNKEISTLCVWFVDDKLSISSWEDKTKYVLFSKTKHLAKFHISYGYRDIKQYHTVEYSGCHIKSNLRGESRAKRVF